MLMVNVIKELLIVDNERDHITTTDSITDTNFLFLDEVLINGIPIIRPDIVTYNGVLHIIGVVFPVEQLASIEVIFKNGNNRCILTMQH